MECSDSDCLQVLKELLIASNSFGPRGAFTLCVGIRQCPTLEYACLDGNVLGEAGARALMSIPLVKSNANQLITSKGCDILARNASCWFNYLGKTHRHVAVF